MRRILSLAFLGLFAVVRAADFTWTGGSGRWSDRENWQDSSVPDSGGTATVFINCGESNIVIDVDVPDMTLKELRFDGSGSIALAGNALSLLCGDLEANGKVDFLEKVTVAGNGHFSVTSDGKVTFHKGLDAMDAVFSFKHWKEVPGYCRFLGPLRVRAIRMNDWTNGNLQLASSGNEWDDLVLDYQNRVSCEVNGALPVSSIVSLGAASVANACWLNLGNRNAQIDRLGGDLSGKYVDTEVETGLIRSYDSENGFLPTILTMRATQNDVSSMAIADRVSLVWDPQDDYELTMTGRISTTTGSITVRRGGFKLSGSGKFSSVPEITVGDGARFSLLSMATDALSGLQLMKLGRNAAFFGAPDVEQSCPKAVIIAAPGTVFHLPKGCRLSVAALAHDGTYLDDGTYSADTCDWIDGEGEINVSCGDRLALWKRPVDGAWSVPENWANGRTPNESTDEILVNASSDKSYVITMDTPVKIENGSLTLANEADGSVRLALSADMTVSQSDLTIGAGGILDIGVGRKFIYRGPQQSGLAGHTVRIEDGGRWVVSGGEAYVTNFVGQFVVRSSVPTPSRIEMTSGRFLYMDNESGSPLTVATGGKLDFTGGTFYLPHHGYNGSSDLRLDGGSLTLSNTVWTAAGKFETISYGGFSSGTGEIVLDEGALVDFPEGEFHVRPNAAGETARLLMRAGSVFPDSAEYMPWSFGGCVGGLSAFDYESGDSVNAKALRIGWMSGLGRLNVKSGVLRVHDLGLSIGYGTSVSAETSVSGDVFVHAGAKVDIIGSCNQGWGADTDYLGLVVGHGIGTDELSTHPCEGKVTVAGDIVNRFGSTVIGSGFGTGVFVQQSGNTSLGQEVTGQGGVCRGTVAVGVFGGEGSVIVSNGTFTTGHGTLFVGGCSPDDFFAHSNSEPLSRVAWIGPAAGTPANERLLSRHDAVGRLTVVDGRVSAPNDAVFGADGSGTLEMIGSRGSFEARDLVLSNATAAVVRFVADGDGISAVDVTRKMSVSATAQCEIDLSAYTGTSRRFCLFRVSEVDGMFDSSNVRVIGTSDRWIVRRSSSGKRIVLVRPSGGLFIVR